MPQGTSPAVSTHSLLPLSPLALLALTLEPQFLCALSLESGMLRRLQLQLPAQAQGMTCELSGTQVDLPQHSACRCMWHRPPCCQDSVTQAPQWRQRCTPAAAAEAA